MVRNYTLSQSTCFPRQAYNWYRQPGRNDLQMVVHTGLTRYCLQCVTAPSLLIAEEGKSVQRFSLLVCHAGVILAYSVYLQTGRNVLNGSTFSLQYLLISCNSPTLSTECRQISWHWTKTPYRRSLCFTTQVFNSNARAVVLAAHKILLSKRFTDGQPYVSARL
jgi:hypothetical protein